LHGFLAEQWQKLNHTMKYLEAHLNPNRFVRVHRQAIVNVSYVVKSTKRQAEMVPQNWSAG
jgi:DNA-binding LytR/AlgR family response regulator